ncbi:hypothetical protein LLE49_19880 [Alicyclobacillus tolerans]|uniref:hypothetical protein n=1 Tax=Alicyclobacillus tolerans TaxID=90970 RepID=UPI001F2B2E0B|nr:hypothetical protein [Alicyclobacillus tolerans]MCF8566984.1 hypothetical protein [Alicyclobacillus tolerans]
MPLQVKKRTLVISGGLVVMVVLAGATLVLPHGHHHVSQVKEPSGEVLSSTVNKNIQNSKPVSQTHAYTSNVLTLLGGSYVTVGVHASPDQAINGQYLGQVCQIYTQQGTKTNVGVNVVPREYVSSDNVLVVSVKQSDLTNLRKEIGQTWFLAHDGYQNGAKTK